MIIPSSEDMSDGNEPDFDIVGRLKRNRTAAKIRSEIKQLESILAGLQSELEAAEEREAVESGGVDAVLKLLDERKARILAKLAGLDAERKELLKHD